MQIHQLIKFEPILKEKIWGGEKLKNLLHKKSTRNDIGESWEISDVEGDTSIVVNGKLAGKDLKELISGLEARLDKDYSIESIINLEKELRTKLNQEISLITLSERGVFIQSTEEHYTADAHPRNIADVSGAGDTVISVAACALAAGASLQTVAELSNLAGGLVCEHTGVVPIDINRLKEEAEKV